MKIKRGNTILCDVYLKNNSYTIDEIMGEQTLTLNFLSRNVVDFEVGDYVDCEGKRYKIRYKEKVTKREKSLGWEYSIVFYSSKYDLEDVTFFLNGKPEFKKNLDYYTGTARDWLNLFVKNMNREDTGWAAGSCIESEWITLSFKDKQVGSVLDELVKQLNTEYWISGKTISIGKRKYSSNGLILGQGEGMGFIELEVSAVDDERPTTVIFPYGSDKNLGPDYGSDYLLLPGGVTELSKNTEKYGRLGQKKIQFDKIFPKGEFLVTARIDETTLQASGIDFNLTDCLLDGVEAIVTFQDGGLAGYDLAIVEGSWDNTTKQFKLKVNELENALKVPGDIHFAVGDKFILTGIKMPQSYIDNASNQLAEEAQAWLDEHCEKRIQLRGKCDEVFFRQQKLFIACGQMVGVYSDQLKIDREIRVTRVKRYLENDEKPAYRYELTLSDFLQGNGFKDLIDDVNKIPEEIEDKVKPVREWSKRSWRDVMETLGMMFDPEGDYFTELIKPLAVHTAQLIVGTNSQQMDLEGVKFIPNADNDPNYFMNTAGKLVHFTISESIREWTIPAASFRLNNSLVYYVYAKCPKEGNAGSIYVTDRKIKLEEVSGYYHFWVGVLNTPEDNVRSWLPNYGYTEIAGQTITTGVIKDKLARVVIDLINGTIYGRLNFASGTTGYENIKDKPDLSIYGTTAMLNAVKGDLQNQIDGKIETYYQSSNPWNSWPSGTEPTHVGDMWYNTSTRMLYRYVGPSSNTWERIYDADAIAAAQAASTAQDTADGKRRVFLSTPYPPYDAGDQWITYGTKGSSMRICRQGRQSGSYVSSDWQLADADGNTQASIDRGVFTGSGFLTFGGTAGLVGSGDVRIWSGGNGVNNATFKVKDNGNVESKGNIYIANINNEKLAGFSGNGVTGSSVRIWAGGSTPESGNFRVTQDGTAHMSKLNATGGNIGRFEINNNRLVWEGRDYFGDSSRTIKLGFGSNNDGLVDVAFGVSTQGRFGVKAVGRAPGSAAIYGSSQSSPSYPTSPTVWAGWFDGHVNAKGYFINGNGGVNWNRTIGSPDLDHIRLIVEGGIITGYYKE